MAHDFKHPDPSAAVLEACKILGPDYQYFTAPHPQHTWLGVFKRELGGQEYNVAFTPREIKAFDARQIVDYVRAATKRAQVKLAKDMVSRAR